MLESATVNRLLCMLMLCAAACVAPNAQPRTSDADEGELVKAPPAAVKLAAAKGLPNPNEVICSFERDTGTNIPERICRTRWQMEQQLREAQEFMEVRSKQCGNGCAH